MSSVADWVIIELEPSAAARAGLPERLAVPAGTEPGQQPIERHAAARWSAAFALGHPGHPLALRLAELARSEPFRRLGERLLREGRFDDAAVALGRAIELTPYDAASRCNRAIALRRAGRIDEALGELTEAEWAYATDAAFYLALGEVYSEVDEAERAIVAFERSLELRPGEVATLERLEQLGALRRLDGPDGEPYWLRPDDFERVIRHELASRIGQPEALVAIGERLLRDGHADLARAAGDLAVDAGASNPTAWALAGRARLAAGDARARAALEQAAKLAPERVDLAQELTRDESAPEGNLVLAEWHLRRNPDSPAAWLVLGDALAASRRDDEALEAYRRALMLCPDLRDAGQARVALARAAVG